MTKNFLTGKTLRLILGLSVMVLIAGGIAAQASGVLNTPSGGYIVCVDSKTKVVTHPGTTSCAKGSKKLVLGAQGLQGTLGNQGPEGVRGLTGATGAAGLNGSNILQGTGTLTNEMGQNGDYYFNSALRIIYGPKTNGQWPAGVNLVGETGPTGSTGPTGPTGANGANGSNATLSCAQGGTCIIGDNGPGGGKVFYVQTPTANAPWRYLEAAPNTWSGDTADPEMVWCSATSNYLRLLSTGATPTSTSTLTSVGSGFRNTKMMLGVCTFGAANLAASYNGGGKSDWFLPSKDELYQMYLQKTVVGGFLLNFYWSSSEATSDDPAENGTLGWRMYSSIGIGSMNFKSESNGVRPVRAF